MEGTDIERLFSGCLNIPFVFTATIGNVLVLGAIWRTSALHSAAYVLIFSLALSDLGVGLICQPSFAIRKIFPGTLESNGLLERVFPACFCSVSLFTVTLIGVDRYLAVKLHLRYKEMVTAKRTVYVSTAVWVASTMATLVFYLESMNSLQVFQFFHCPIIVTCFFTNIFVYRKLYRVCRYQHAKIQDQTVFQQDSGLSQRNANEARFKKSVKRMIFIVFALIFCYLPFWCYKVLMAVHSYNSKPPGFTFTVTFLYINSSINPALLYFQITDLRLAIKQMINQALDC